MENTRIGEGLTDWRQNALPLSRTTSATSLRESNLVPSNLSVSTKEGISIKMKGIKTHGYGCFGRWVVSDQRSVDAHTESPDRL